MFFVYEQIIFAPKLAGTKMRLQTACSLLEVAISVVCGLFT